MSFFKSKVFDRFARKQDLTDAELCAAAKDVVAGNTVADLGGGVFKQRLARAGGGKSGGFRTVILYKQRGHVFFVYGFAKSEQANISPKELFAFKNLANLYAELSPTKLASALASRELIEVENDEDGTESEETHGA